MDQQSVPTHSSQRDAEPRGDAQIRAVIREAVELLCERREIDRMSAYEILVRASAEEHRSVRDVAMRVLESSDQTRR
jgi:AmiR/NasT family two-component response regulator